jgi:hypothetical protein
MRKLINIPALILLAFSLQWLGSLCNHTVMTANGGRMPVLNFSDQVEQSTMFDDRHTVLTKDSQYWILSDIFVVPLFYYGGMGWEAVSIGDIEMDIGTYLILFTPLLIPYWIVRWLWRKL